MYMNSLDLNDFQTEEKQKAMQKLSDIFMQNENDAKDKEQNEQVRQSKDFKIRNQKKAKDQPTDINSFLKKNKYARAALVRNFRRDKQKLVGYDFLSEQSAEEFMNKKHQSDRQMSNTMANSNFDQQTDSQKHNIKYQRFSENSQSQPTIHHPLRPKTAKLEKVKSPNKLNDNNTLVKIPEDYTLMNKMIGSSPTNQRFSSVMSSHRYTPRLFKNNETEFYNKSIGKNFINRIERRAISATRKLKTNFDAASLALNMKTKYKMLIMNWAKELEKHDKILQKFHIFSPLKYDIDATFHKLFSSKSKSLIKQKLKHKKKNQYK